MALSTTQMSGTRRSPRFSLARIGVALAAIVGVALAVGLMFYFGFGGIVSAIARIGWLGFGAYILFSLAVFPITGGAWYVLAPRLGLDRLVSFTWGRVLREGASDLLPFSAVGAVLIGARGVVLRGVDPARAYGSLIWDLITEIVAQILFLAIGLGLLSAHLSGARMDAQFETCFAVAMASAAFMIGGMMLAQRRGLDLLDRFAERFAPSTVVHVQGVREMVDEIKHRPSAIVWSVVWHLAGWLAPACGVWMLLDFMGADIPLLSVIAVESLLSAVKSAAFVAPGGIGVQEAVYVTLGHLFGLTPEVGLAVSILKRAKDLAIGAPALVLWQGLEGRRLLRSGPPPQS